MSTLDRPALREPANVERLDIDGLRAALGHQLRHAQADGGRDLEPGAAEGGGKKQTGEAVHAPQERVAIRAVPVEAPVDAGTGRALCHRHARTTVPGAD